MKIPFLASLFIFLLVLGRALKKSTCSMEKEQQSFWQKERSANSVRKKSLDCLDYLSIPLEHLPTKVHSEDSFIKEYIEILTTLSECKIVNFTGISNTDLKLAYGTANITVLTEYDQNYTILVTTLQKWADRLYSLKDMDSAETVLEYAVSVGSDVTQTYLLLAEIYKKQGTGERIEELMTAAGKLTTPSGKIILRKLQDERSV